MSDSDDDEQIVHRFKIVKFIKRGRKSSTKEIDIVPSTWINWDKNTKRLKVPFLPPPYTKEGINNLHDLVKNELEAPESWPLFSVDIVGQASALVDALKRGDWTPLMLACTKSGHAACQCISVLLVANANAHLRNKDGWTPLLIACRVGDENAINLLLKHSPKCIDDRSNNGRNALHIAAFHGHEKVINLLTVSNTNLLNAQDSAGSSPLHEAIKHENLNAAVCLIHLGANVSLVNNINQTILHVAALTGNVKAIEYILKHHLIDVNCEASYGITPLMIARRSNYSDIIQILIKFGAK